jgi:16S rRNA (cytosine967-C5)-methyltransferase
MILDEIGPGDFAEKDRALTREMTFGAVKYKRRLEFIAQAYIKAPIKSQTPETRAALILGFYQLTEMSSVPNFAAVDETVSAAKRVISEKGAGFINAVLRAYLMQPDKARFPDKNSAMIQYLSLYYSYPEWLVRRWLERLGYNETESLLKAGNRRPEANFRVLESRISTDEAMKVLSGKGIEVESAEHIPGYLRTSDPGRILEHELFKTGRLIVQDESQGLPLYLLDPPPGSRVLDLCAAPGGKSIVLADVVGKSGKVTAVDYNPARLRMLEENIARTGFGNIEIREGDVLEFEPGAKFDYILLDVPCSGLGTISVNADLRWTKSEKDIMLLSETQKKLLRKAADFAAEEAAIVYSTCTTEPEEIEEVVFDFLDQNDDFSLVDGNREFLEPFKTETGIYRSWPHKHGTGGGGFARLKRSS